MEQLIQDIENLEKQEQNFQNELNNAESDAQANALIDELNIVRNKLSEKRAELEALKEKEQQRAEVIEEKVQSEGVPFAVAGIDFKDLPAEVITLIDAVVRADRRRLLNEHAIEMEQLEQEYFLKDQNRIKEYNDLEADLHRIEANEERLGEEVNRLSAQVYQLDLEKRDAEEKRDAAVADKEVAEYALSEAHEEIARLQSQVEDYQRAKVFGERQAQQIIDVTPEENNSISAAVEAVKKLYTHSEDWGSVIKVYKPDGSFERVKRDELDADWTPVVPEVLQFREEADSTGNEAIQPTFAEAPEIVGESFQGDTTEQQSDHADADGTNVGDVSEAKFREEVRWRLAQLEMHVFHYKPQGDENAA